MALGKYGSSNVKLNGFDASNVDSMDEGLGQVYCTRAMGRKRIVVSNYVESLTPSSHFRTPSKRRLNMVRNKDDSEKSLLEALPQDILVRVLCFVDHDDLKQLIQVSKPVRDATLIAKQSHFAYSTPRAKRIPGLRTLSSDLELESPEAPNAPEQKRGAKSRISGKKLSEISVALFNSPEDDDLWSKCIIR
ncbi:F-box protein SKIP27-like [Macadamia integrifolia]|uniref:F-box protein SKIP27-like n=1 Tax=Macadamia integrifolia TaxID=60698 RepID=UPI001C52EEE6|nr:F-box protein SKIP27-like [Macadamia integrifolia]